MALDKIEYVDLDYNRCSRNGKARVIKARMSSFRSIADRFNKFRIKLLEDKLEKMKNKSLEEKYKKDSFDKKIEKKTKAIAKLEEKIMVLSKEEVPNDYVSKRAIKLKKSMIDNLMYNSGMFYTIDIENKNEIFGNDLLTEYDEQVEPLDDLTSEPESFIDVDGLHDDGVELEEVIPEMEVASGSNDNSLDAASDNINRQSIAEVVNAEFDEINAGEEERVLVDEPENDNENISSGEMTKEEVKEAIENAFKEVELSSELRVDSDKVEEEVDSAIERIRVSQNNVNSINTDKFDDNGEIKPRTTGKYQYVPMTDEEIKESQRKLGFDSDGNLMDNSSNNTLSVDVPKVSLDEVFVPKNSGVDVSTDREFPIVVEERKENEDVFDLDGEKNMFDVIADSKDDKKDLHEGSAIQEFSFDSSEEEKVGDAVKGSDVSSKLDDYLSLKDKILQLQKQRQASLEKKIKAQKEAEERALKAQEVKKMFEESQKSYEQSLERLRAYTESLEAECEINSKDAEMAENDAQMSENFIELQQKKADDNYRVINEINGIINGESDESSDDLGGKSK